MQRSLYYLKCIFKKHNKENGNFVQWGSLGFFGFFGVWVLLGRGIHCHVGGQTNRSSACEINCIIWLLWRAMEPSQKSWAEEEATYLSLLLPPSVRPRRTFKIIQTIVCCVVLFLTKRNFPKRNLKRRSSGKWTEVEPPQWQRLMSWKPSLSALQFPWESPGGPQGTLHSKVLKKWFIPVVSSHR